MSRTHISEHATSEPEAPVETPKKEQRAGMYQVPGSRWTYTPGYGVWNESGKQLLSWCPEITENLISYRDDGRIFGQQVTIKVGIQSATAPMDEVETGRVWTEALPHAVGTADRKIKDALTNIIKNEARRLPEKVGHPRWNEDRLELPPAECLPDGYLRRGGTMKGWIELVKRSMDTPKIALVMALAVAGIYVQPTQRQSYVVHLKGISSRGKTTAMTVAAGIFGNPAEDLVVTNWNISAKGVPAWLRGMRVLTGFRDELQSAGLRPQELQALMFQVTQGAQRGVSSRTGMYRAPAAGWHGALISSGNVSILGTTDNTAMFARVIEIDTPFTQNAEQSEAFTEMALNHFGWGLPAIAELGVSPADWVKRCAKARIDLGTPVGDVLGRAGKHLSGGIAGAQLIAEITGISGFESVVLQAAKEALQSVEGDLGFKGSNSPAQQYLYALSDAIARNPGMFPTPNQYEIAKNSDHRTPDIYGWDIANEKQDGDVALLPSGFKKIAQEYEITDTLIVLKELQRTGQLFRNKSGRDLTKQIKICGKKERAYVIGGIGQGEETPISIEGNDRGTDTCTDAGNDTKNRLELGGTDGTDIFALIGRMRDASDDELISIMGSRTASDAEVGAAADELQNRENAPQKATEAQTSPVRGNRKQEEKKREPTPKKTVTGGPSKESEANWAAWLDNATVQADLEERGITVTTEVAHRALLAWHTATGGMFWDSTPGRVGKNLYRLLRAKHKNMPEIKPMEDELANEISTGKELLLRADFINSLQRPECGNYITSADVNNQFLAAAGMVRLGDGEPTVIKKVRSLDMVIKDPGYVILSKELVIDDHPAFMDRTIPAGTPVPMPMVNYLHQWGAKLAVKEAVVWTTGGERLDKHSKTIQEWMTHLQQWTSHEDTETRGAAQIALAAVKSVYAVTYGGQLRSEKYADEMLRRDWSDMLVSLANANALRGLDRAAYGIPVVDENGKRNTYRKVLEAREKGQKMGNYALGLIKDTAYFLHENPEPTLPSGLEVPKQKQVGKWKQEKHVGVTPEIEEAYARGIFGLRNSVNEEWKAKKAGQEAKQNA